MKFKNYNSIKVSRRAYGSSCDYTYQCVIGLGLICPSTGSTCTCDNGLYWTGSICGINNFKTNLSLRIKANLSFTKQKAVKFYYGASCTSHLQCYTGYCSTSGASGCNCPLALTASKCDCSSGQFYQDDRSTNPSYSCASRYSYGTSCKFHYQCASELQKD